MNQHIERYLNVRSATSPSFSADGQRIAFVSNITGVPLPWSVPTSGGWPSPICLAGERTLQVAYSPRNDQVAFDRDTGGDEHWQIIVSDEASGDTNNYTEDPDISHRFGGWSPDGSAFYYSANIQERRRFDVYVQSLSDPGPKLVYVGSESSEPVAWAPGGNHIVVREGTRNEDSDLYLVGLQLEEVIHLTPHSGEAAYYPFGFSKNGRLLFLRTDQDEEFVGIAALDLKTSLLSYLVKHKWDIDGAALAPNKRTLVYSKNVDGFSEIIVRGMRSDEEIRVLGLRMGVASGLTWAPNSRSLAFAFNSALATSNIWRYDIRREQLYQITHAPSVGLKSEALVEPEVVRFPSVGGLEIPGLLYAPHGAQPDGNNAVIVHVHGGPVAQSRPVFEPVLQYFANRGYVVLSTNVRGSTGYGRTYSHLDDVRKRMDSVADLESANSWLRSTGWGHPRRIAVMGASYGGFMVLSALTNYPDSWAAGVNERGVADFIMHLERTEPQGRRSREVEYGTIEQDGEFLRSISPIHYVEKIRVPMIVIHGANDPRVSIRVAEALVAQLREYNVPVEYLRFEDEGHGMVRLPNRLRAYPAIADFLDKQVKNVP